MASYMNTDMNGYSYGSEYEYEANGYSYGSDFEYDSEGCAEFRQIAEAKQLLVKEKEEKQRKEKEVENALKLKKELGVVSSFLNWVTATPNTQTVEKLSFEDEDLGWQKVSYEKPKKEEKEIKKEIKNVTKTEICRSVGKSKCVHKSCRYAHSILELNIIDCEYGSKCRAIYYDAKKKLYLNDTKKPKVCMRIHPKETKENFYSRANKSIPVTEEEMDLTYSCILEFEENNKKFLDDIENKRMRTPCNKSIVYEIPTPYYVIKALEYGLLPAEETPKKVIKEVKKVMEPKKIITKKENKKDENAKNQQKIANLQIKIEEIEKKIKANKNIIDRFSARVDNDACQKKCVSLRAENEMLCKNLDNFKNDIEKIKNQPKKEEPKKEEKIVTVKNVEVEETFVNKIFNVCAKSFKAALGVISNEPSQLVTDLVKEKIDETPVTLKTIMCKSYGKYTCPIGVLCKFAHSLKELNIKKCAYGCSCFDVEFVAGSYINKNNVKNRICQRQHPEETIQNVHKRIGIVEEKPKMEVVQQKPKTDFVYKKVEVVQQKCKTELCRSVGKYICRMGTDCRFAHNSKELKVIPCCFGSRCFDVELYSGVYRNINNMKNRICQRQHPDETFKNVHVRLGLY